MRSKLKSFSNFYIVFKCFFNIHEMLPVITFFSRFFSTLSVYCSYFEAYLCLCRMVSDLCRNFSTLFPLRSNLVRNFEKISRDVVRSCAGPLPDSCHREICFFEACASCPFPISAVSNLLRACPRLRCHPGRTHQSLPVNAQTGKKITGNQNGNEESR